MDNDQLKISLQRYLNNAYSWDDFKIIQDHFQNEDDRVLLYDWIGETLEQETEPELQESIDRILRATDQDIFQNLGQSKRHRSTFAFRRARASYRNIAAAVALFLGISLGCWSIYQNYIGSEPYFSSALRHDITPGGNRATLTLPNGTHIELEEGKSGITIEAGQIKYNDGGVLPIPGQLNGAAGDLTIHDGDILPFLSLSTPNGGQYRITLPDGSKVWLNAASTLKYPINFSGSERRVELDGEAYFEVASRTAGKSDPDQQVSPYPFIVVSGRQETTVLGTRFNIHAYPDESSVQTTVLEGSVRVSDRADPAFRATLTAGQQSIVSKDDIQVISADPSYATAWKEGYFRFDDEPLESIMKTTARWYDVEVVFEDSSLKSKKFVGTVTRHTNVSTLLALLSKSADIHFELTGKRITIRKKPITNN